MHGNDIECLQQKNKSLVDRLNKFDKKKQIEKNAVIGIFLLVYTLVGELQLCVFLYNYPMFR